MDDFVQVSQLWPLIGYFIAVLVVVGAMLGIPQLLGRGRHGRYTEEPYESGIVPVGDVHVRLAVQYYPVAIFFVIFDLEAIFIFAWAVSFREAGWMGYVEMLVFIGILLATLVYLWRVGALDWRTRRQRCQDAYFTPVGRA
ncbi:NADH-quinone oxidoreductase subunit A [Methylomagnum sp.]